MPYLKQLDKDMANKNPVYGKGNPGVLNYRLTRAIIEWLPREPKYADFDAAIGALECCKQEFYRRVVGPYEDDAIERNGDVYPDWLLPEPEEPKTEANPQMTIDDMLDEPPERRYI